MKYKTNILNQENLTEIQKQEISPANNFPDNKTIYAHIQY
jgi:hypothetical protein